MSDLSFARFFRLRPGGVECDAGGLRVGGVALVARDANGAWTRRDEGDLSRELSKLYGFPLDFGSRRRGVDAVAAALAKRGNRPRPDCRVAAAASRPSRIRGGPIRQVGETPTRGRTPGLRPSEGGRRLGRKASASRRAAQPWLVCPNAGSRGWGRAKDQRERCGGRVVARRRDAGLCRPGAGRRRRLAARRRPVGGRRAWAGGVGRPPIRRNDPFRRRSSSRATTASSRRAPSPAVPTSPIAGRTTKAQPR